MKITDEIKEFISPHRFGTDKLTIQVASNHWGEHEKPSLCLGVHDPSSDTNAVFGTDDPEQIKEIIEHMAKMAGLSVTFKERFEPVYQPGDRVRSQHEDDKGDLGTVHADQPHPLGWNVSVLVDGDTGHRLYMYSELELVTKSSS